MRFARKLTLLALAAVAAMAFAAAPASATDPISVVNEKTATVCSEVLSPHTVGGCTVHAAGTVAYEVFLLTWVTERNCDVELEMRIGGDGTAAVYDLDHYSVEASNDSDCQIRASFINACELPWEGGGEELGAGTTHVTNNVCYDFTESDICADTVEYALVERADETLSFGLSEAVGLCRISGTLSIESEVTGNAAIHINHL